MSELQESEVALAFTDVVKTFPGVIALKHVSMTVRRGEVHALVGENGAGKSTLMAIASGAEKADSGSVVVAGHRLSGGSPREARDHGVAIVYQHASITADLTVEENLILGIPSRLRPSRAESVAWARRQLASSGADHIHPAQRVSTLSPADRQLVEITKATAADASVLILDEPTESLTVRETERLFAHIRRVAAEGTTVVYISHRLGDVKQISDRLTVLRDGETRGTFETSAISEHEILELIVGRNVEHAFPEKASSEQVGPVVLELSGFGSGRARDVNLQVRAGEIVGLAGIDGNGQHDLVLALAGLQASTGRAILHGRPLDLSSPRASMRSGVAHLPADRHADGLFLSLSVRENLTPLRLPALSRIGVISRPRERDAARAEIDRFRIRTPSSEQPVRTLSGGNQQKILFARSVSIGADVLVVAEPTRGVDVGARLDIYNEMRRLTGEGKSVIVMSSDALELQGLCDRVFVLSRGEIVASLDGRNVTESAITGAALNARVETGVVEIAAIAGSARAAWRRFRNGDYFPAALVALLCIVFTVVTTSQNALFLGDRSLSGILLLLIPLAIVSVAQFVTIVSGGFDLSVGSVMSVSVTIMSYYAHRDQSPALLVVGIAMALLVGLAFGLVNAIMIVGAGFSPVLATLVTLIVGQGVALLLRPTPGGNARGEYSGAFAATLGPIPVAALVCVVLVVLADLVLRFSVVGMQVRAIGSDAARAKKLGVRVNATKGGVYLLSSLLASVAGICLYFIIGIGDATLGVNYLLLSISAVVLGGASIYGGSGSVIGTFLAAVLIQVVVSSGPFLNLPTAWQSLLPGLMIVIGAALYARARTGMGGQAGGTA